MLYLIQIFVQRAKEIDSIDLSRKIIESYRTRGGVEIGHGLYLHLKQMNGLAGFTIGGFSYMFSRHHWKEALTILDKRPEFISPLQFIVINKGFLVEIYSHSPGERTDKGRIRNPWF